MEQRDSSAIGRYRGPALTVGLAVSLIAALAIPTYVNRSSAVEPVAYELHNDEAGTVAEILVAPNQSVRRGDALVLLTSESLDQEIAAADKQIAQLRLGTKAAVADPVFLGNIGSVRTVVEETPSQTETLPPVTPVAPVQTIDPKVQAEVLATRKSIAAHSDQISKVDRERTANQEELVKAKAVLDSADQALIATQATQATVQKDVDKMQRLFDIGAIAKRRLDSSKAAKALADQDVADAQARKDGAETSIQSLNKDAADLGAKLEATKQDIATLTAKLAALEAKLKVKTAVPAATTAPKPKPQIAKKKVVFGSAPIGSTAPVSVKLVDTNDPVKEKGVQEAKKALEALKSRRQDLTITAPFDGRIKRILVTKGSALEPNSVVIVLEAKN